MAKVECDIEEALVEHKGRSVDGLCATCGLCEHSVEIPGRDTMENRQKLKDQLRTSCPERMRNSYCFPTAERMDVDLDNE